MSAVEEYSICVYMRMVRNAAPLHKGMIDFSGKSAHLQLPSEVLEYYSNAAANEERY